MKKNVIAMMVLVACCMLLVSCGNYNNKGDGNIQSIGCAGDQSVETPQTETPVAEGDNVALTYVKLTLQTNNSSCGYLRQKIGDGYGDTLVNPCERSVMVNSRVTVEGNRITIKESGIEITIVAFAEDGHTFERWQYREDSEANPFNQHESKDVKVNVTITAVFR